MKDMHYKAVVFDMDGVLTRTAHLHAMAWKQMFDAYLERRSLETGEQHEPFDIGADYRRYVDGKPRYDGVRSFLNSRNIELPEGTPDDAPDSETVYGLGQRKNTLIQSLIQEKGAEPYQDAVEQLARWRSQGLKTAMITASRNGAMILGSAGLSDLFDAKVDGLESEKRGIPGKPAPDIFLEAARRMGVTPQQTVVIEDAIAGVEAGRVGGSGWSSG
jgi:trehalose 6-phosphate phosphatase